MESLSDIFPLCFLCMSKKGLIAAGGHMQSLSYQRAASPWNRGSLMCELMVIGDKDGWWLVEVSGPASYHGMLQRRVGQHGCQYLWIPCRSCLHRKTMCIEGRHESRIGNMPPGLRKVAWNLNPSALGSR
jgi:hypothetical protein